MWERFICQEFDLFETVVCANVALCVARSWTNKVEGTIVKK